MRALAALLCALLALAGCGVGPQERPETVSVPRPPATGPGPAPGSGGSEVVVYFVRDARLQPVTRSTAEPGLDAALDLLLAGPRHVEVVDGVRTALSPQSLMPEPAASADAVVTIPVAREFTDVSGPNQLLAVAQVVWTVTEFPEVDRVRVTVEGRPLEVPTDAGLTDQSVGRGDYASIAPDPPAGPGPPADAPGDGDPTAAPAPPGGPTRHRRRAVRRRAGPGDVTGP